MPWFLLCHLSWWQRNFGARHGKVETGAVVKNRKGLSDVEGGKGIWYQWKERGQCSKGDQCSFRHESNDRAKPTPKAERPSEPQSSKSRGGSVPRKRNARDRSQSEKLNRPPCKYLSRKVLARDHFVSVGILPNVNSLKRNRDVSSAQSAHSRTGRLKNNQTKSRKRVMTKMQLLWWKKSVRGARKHRETCGKGQLMCVSQDVEPPDSATISRKGPRVLGPIRRVRFTEATQRHADIRENEGPSLGNIQVKIPHQRSPYAMKFEDRSKGETEREEECARGDAWRLAKNTFKLKETDKATGQGESDELSSPTPRDESTRDDEKGKKWLLVFYGTFHLSPSRGTQNQTVHAERRTFPIRRKYIDTCQMHPNVKENHKGLSKNPNSTMPEKYVVFISFIPRTRNSRISWKTLMKS